MSIMQQTGIAARNPIMTRIKGMKRKRKKKLRKDLRSIIPKRDKHGYW